MLHGEHSAKLLTFIKLLFVIKTFVLSIFELPLKTGFTVVLCLKVNIKTIQKHLRIFVLELKKSNSFGEFKVHLIHRKPDPLLHNTVLILCDEGAGLMGMNGPVNAVCNASDCRSRGCEFDPSTVPYFHGD